MNLYRVFPSRLTSPSCQVKKAIKPNHFQDNFQNLSFMWCSSNKRNEEGETVFNCGKFFLLLVLVVLKLWEQFGQRFMRRDDCSMSLSFESLKQS